MYTSSTTRGITVQRQCLAPRHIRGSVCLPSPASLPPGQRRPATLARAGADDQWPAPSSYKLWPTEISISGGVYNLVQGAELLAYGALVDAGFSGDWSRIGVLTTGQELLAQQACWFILVAHSVVAAIAVKYALRQGYPPLQAGARGLLFGTLGLYDIYVRCQGKRAQQS